MWRRLTRSIQILSSTRLRINENKLRKRVTLLLSTLQTGKDHIERFEVDLIDKHGEDRDVAERQMARDALKDQLKDKEETFRQVHVGLTVASSELEACALERRKTKKSNRSLRWMYRCKLLR